VLCHYLPLIIVEEQNGHRRSQVGTFMIDIGNLLTTFLS
jgi:hypothetical protein